MMGAARRVRAAVTAGVVLASALVLGSPGELAGMPPTAAYAAPVECNAKAGGTYTGSPWAQTRLSFRQAWPVSTGVGVTVAVIDSGLDLTKNHITMRVTGGANVIGDGTGTRDCFKHGTEVAAIIAAQHTDSAFVGVAPGATVLPIKFSAGENGSGASGSQSAMAKGIRHAVDAGAQVINISAGIASPARYLSTLQDAVRYADSKGVVIVAAAGNDGSQSNLPAYPAAFSTSFGNVIAVSMTDAADTASPLSNSGTYVTIAAPGVSVWVPAPNSGFLKETGTSYAAPYVAGTVALMLQADPSLARNPEAVRQRLIATADPPATATPSKLYGYGIVDPYLAVTSLSDDTPLASDAPSGSAVAQPLPPTHTDRSLQHTALAVALSLLGLALVAAVASGVVRASRRGGRAR